MNQADRRKFLIKALISEQPRYKDIEISEETLEQKKLLASCYESCLRIADENGVKSVSFCCISTGVFMFPNKKAAKIAVDTVREYKKKNKSEIKVIFNVFKDEDLRIYEGLLG